MSKHIPHTIKIAVDHAEAEEFCDWINLQGHRCVVGKSTGNYVNGAATSASEYSRMVMNKLWNDYCNQPEGEEIWSFYKRR